MKKKMPVLKEKVVETRQMPEYFQFLLNPCDWTISKRTWENRCAAIRRGWMSAHLAPPIPLADDRDGALARLHLQQQFFFPTGHSFAGEMEQRAREFGTAIGPVLATLATFPQLLWTLLRFVRDFEFIYNGHV